MDKQNSDILIKATSVAVSDVTTEDLEKINRYTLKPLTADDVAAYKLYMCDNEDDDRNHEPFKAQALHDMKDLFIGKTVLKDHRHSTDSQIGRLFETWIETDPTKITKSGEVHTELHGRFYIPKTAKNADLMADLDAGIRGECSVGFRPTTLICSICGTDNMKSYCHHWPGQTYMTEGGEKQCMMTIEGVKDALEVSLVGVPAQPRSGTHKEVQDELQEKESMEKRASDLSNRMRVAEALFNIQKGEMENE